MRYRPSTLLSKLPAGVAPRRLFKRRLRVPAHLRRHARAYWGACACVLALWLLAFSRIFIDPAPHVPILFNWTPSLPYKVAVVRYGNWWPLHRGDFIIYAFDGQAQRIYPGLRAQPFFKQVIGLPGDRIAVVGNHVFVNEQDAGAAKPHTFDGHPLDPIEATVIPADHYYVHGTHPDSFDSRYRASGLVRADQVIGRVVPIF
ncbi:MAG: conjugative transfer signal peptidase TraF [Pseudomonadota bacterium]